jgi:hypothetical protein
MTNWYVFGEYGFNEYGWFMATAKVAAMAVLSGKPVILSDKQPELSQ